MDVRKSSGRPRRRLWWAGIGVAVIAGLTIFIGTLRPAPKVVDHELLVIGTAQRGPMIRQVHGWGSFVPDRVQMLRSDQPGLVAAVYVIAGQEVRAGDRLVELSNPEIDLAVGKAEQKFAAARGGMIALSREQSARRLALEASIADTRITFLHAEDELEELRSRSPGKVREIEIRRAKERVEALERRLGSDEERLALITSSTEQQMAAQRDELRWVESILEAERARQRSLTLRAAGDGAVEQVLVEPGSRVAGGEVVARVALSDRLKAEIKVSESEAAEIVVGQPVSLKAATDALSGTVAEIGPVPGKALVAVTVALDQNPRIPVDGDHDAEAMIHVGTLADVLSVDRPAYAAAGEPGTVFRVSLDGSVAERVKVKFGRGSVDRIEVLYGLEAGDRIVVSDVSGFDDLDSFEIE
jgi:multidrug efflux pump subunit AcrA (membrane-fusion protein)